MRHAYGEMYWNDGTIYKGEWQLGAQHGAGELILPNGEVKKGFFENNVFQVETKVKPQNLKREDAEDIIKEDKPEAMKFEEQGPTEIMMRQFAHAEQIRESKEAVKGQKQAKHLDSQRSPQAQYQNQTSDQVSQTRLTLKCIKTKSDGTGVRISSET
jgi:hypothetical protein